jgi:hypothetical protein
MILSLRQKIHIEDFAPFVVVGIPIMVRVFFNSYRVRLPIHRVAHRRVAIFVFVILAVSTFFSFVNKPLYPFFKNYKKHFAYRYHVAKELANELKNKGIISIKIDNDKLKKRLKFYGIKNQKKGLTLVEYPVKNYKHHIMIKYYGKKVGDFYIF